MTYAEAYQKYIPRETEHYLKDGGLQNDEKTTKNMIFCFVLNCRECQYIEIWLIENVVSYFSKLTYENNIINLSVLFWKQVFVVYTWCK